MVIMFVFKFIYKLRKKFTDTLELMKLAKVHLIKTQQNVYFSEDLLYLEGKVKTYLCTVPGKKTLTYSLMIMASLDPKEGWKNTVLLTMIQAILSYYLKKDILIN